MEVNLLQNRGFEECVFQVAFRTRFQLITTCGFVGTFRCEKCPCYGVIPENGDFAAEGLKGVSVRARL